MRFVPSAEQRAFSDSLAQLLAAADLPAVIRSWSAGDVAPGRKLWSRLADQGVLALCLPADDGGFGATPVDLVLAFEKLGRFAVPGPYVESVAVLPALLAGSALGAKRVAIGAGEVMATLSWSPHVPCALDAAYADAVFAIVGGQVHHASAAGRWASVDKARWQFQVEPGDAAADVRADVAGDAFDRGVLAVAAQLHGLGAAVLEMATAYAKQRAQFGNPIGSFQAVKHHLADAAVALDMSRPLLLGAALAIGTPAAPRDVSAAKVACGDAAYLATRTALQVHGAIGYTAEYDLALWLTKIRALLSAWGTAAYHRRRVLAALT